MRGFAPARIGALPVYTLILAGSLLPSASFAAALERVREEWAISSAQAGLVYSIYQLGYILAVVLVLPLTDRVDSRKVVALGSLTTLLASLLFPLGAQGFASALALRGLAGLGLGAVYMPGLRLVARRHAGERLGWALGLYVAGYYVGNGASLGLTGLFLEAYPWRPAFLAVASLGLALVVPLLWPALSGPGEPTVGATRPSLRALANWAVLLFIVGYCAHAWQLFSVWGWLASYLTDVLERQGYGSAVGVAGAISAVVLGLGAVGVWTGGALSDRFGRPATAAAILGLGGAISLAFGWLHQVPLPLLVALSLPYALLISASSPIYAAGISEVAPAGLLGSALALQASLGYLAGLAGPVAFGAVLDLAGGPEGWGPAFATAGLAALGGAFAMLRLGVARPAPVPAPEAER